MPSIIFLTGFSGTGKSQVGQEVARLLGWELVDTDEDVVALAQKGIAQIFTEDGEARFRELERLVLGRACQGERRVVATGGGVVVDPANRELMERHGVVICLEARPETIHHRLRRAEEAEDLVVRPLLQGSDPLERIRQLKERRQPLYALADWTVHTDQLTLEEVAQEVVRGWQRIGGLGDEADAASACVVRTSSASYPVYVGWGLLSDLGARMRGLGLEGRAHVVSDQNVSSIYRQPVSTALKSAGFDVNWHVFPAGEGSKSLEMAHRLYDWLVESKAERREAVVALGGGVVGDLAGYMAATYLRGVPLVQVPTSLLAMVDASIGGKVAVNHPRAKNLIGAFYQPRLVLMDVATLATLPQREFREGWAEVVKHGVILDEGLFQTLEGGVEKLVSLEKDITVDVIRRSVAIKARVVSQDEKETTGFRTLLNYGHTLGHALEAASGYDQYLHGEAVSIGMMAAILISQRLGMVSVETVERQRLLLERFGLPLRASGVGRDALSQAMTLDKKVKGRVINWVLLEGIGRAIVRSDVPSRVVREVLEETVLT